MTLRKRQRDFIKSFMRIPKKDFEMALVRVHNRAILSDSEMRLIAHLEQNFPDRLGGL